MMKNIMKYVLLCFLVVVVVCMFASKTASHEGLKEWQNEITSNPSFSSAFCSTKAASNMELCISSLNIQGSILPYEGKSLAKVTPLLKNSIVWLQNGAELGGWGNVVLFGHSSDYPWDRGPYKDIFGNIHSLKNGDEIAIISNEQTFVYTVQDNRVVSARNISVIENTPNTKSLKLITCWPKGTSLKRLVVSAELKE